ncbi:MAG: SRPBCC domain-containing protein [Planctomycetota bacterium]
MATQTDPKTTLAYEGRFEMPAGADRVFRALTDPAQVERWFAEKTELSDRIGGPFRFWGRYTAMCTREDQADQRLTEFEPGRRLAFTWGWIGNPTRVELAIEEGEPATLRIRHTAEREFPGFERCGEHLMNDFWRVAAENLRSFLASGEPALMVEHGRAGGDAALSIDIEAPIERVWACLTDKEELDAWLTHGASVRLEPGGAYDYGWEINGNHCGPRSIVEIDPPRRLVHDWSHVGDETTRTEWLLDPIEGGTRVTVRQLGTGSERELSGYSNGWAAYLHLLRARATGGPPAKKHG